MKNGLRTLYFVGLTVMGLIIVVSVALGLREPAAQGRSLTFWLDQINRGTEVGKSSKAIREMGPQCLPWLLRQIGSRESWLHASARDFLAKRKLLNLKFRDPAELEMASFYALAELGDAAKPVFARIDFNHPRAEEFVCALGAAGPATREGLVRACSSTNKEVRIRAAMVLGKLNSNAAAPGFWQWTHSGARYGMTYGYQMTADEMIALARRLMNDPSVVVRKASEESLGYWTEMQVQTEARIQAAHRRFETEAALNLASSIEEQPEGSEPVAGPNSR